MKGCEDNIFMDCSKVYAKTQEIQKEWEFLLNKILKLEMLLNLGLLEDLMKLM